MPNEISPAEPLVSVVMPVYQVEDYLPDAIDSLRRQTYRNLEVILVDDGSPDSCGEICDAYATRDARIRVVHRDNGGLALARNTGAAAATGEFLSFVDGDDLLEEHAYERMVGSLLESGSDFATGNVQRFTARGRWQAAGQRESHRSSVSGTTLLARPELLFDAIACNKVFRRDFFVGQGITFPEGRFFEDMVPMFGAYRAARSVDVLRQPVYLWRMREDGASLSQQRTHRKNLADKALMLHIIHRQVQELALPELSSAFYRKALETDLWLYLRRVGPGTASDFLELLTRAVRTYWSSAPPAVRAGLPLERRVQYRALCEGKAQLLQPIRQWFDDHHGRLPIREEQGDVFLDHSALPVGWPVLTRLDRSLGTESQVQSQVTEVAWDEGAGLHIGGWSRLPIRPVEEQDVQLLMESPASGDLVDLPTATAVEATGRDVARDDDHRAASRVRFEATLDRDTLLALAGRGGSRRWFLAVEVSTPQVVRRSRLRSFARDAARLPEPRFLDDSVQAVPLATSRRELAVDLRR